MTLAAALLLGICGERTFQDQAPKKPPAAGPQDAEKPKPPNPAQETPAKQEEEKPKPQAPDQEVPPKQETPESPPAVPEDDPDGSGLRAAARGGFWFHREFEAQTPNGRRRIKRESMGEGGVDLEYRLERWSFRASFDYAQADDVSAWVAGLHVGHVESLDFLPIPLSAGLSVGVIAGQLDVDLGGFGDFEAAVGFQARGELFTPVAPGVSASLWTDYRHLRFDFDEPVTAGDKEAFGPTVAVGAALTLRF